MTLYTLKVQVPNQDEVFHDPDDAYDWLIGWGDMITAKADCPVHYEVVEG